MTVMSNLYFSSLIFWVLIESTFALNPKQLKEIIYLVFVLFYCGCCFYALFWLFPASFSLAFSCKFDSDTCGFVQLKNDKFDWSRNKGGTSSSSTGPSSDHTSGQGEETNISDYSFWLLKGHAYFRPFGCRPFVRVPFGTLELFRLFSEQLSEFSGADPSPKTLVYLVIFLFFSCRAAML